MQIVNNQKSVLETGTRVLEVGRAAATKHPKAT